MSNQKIYNDNESDDNFDLKKEFFRYLFFWKYFLFSLLFFSFVALLINRYSEKIYETTAKIKILDKKDSALEMPSAEDLFSSSKINLENEIEVIKSSPILKRVINNLNLSTEVYGVGHVVKSLKVHYPFEILIKRDVDSICPLVFDINVNKNSLIINQYANKKFNIEKKEYFFDNLTTLEVKHDLPFEIKNIKIEDWYDESYEITLFSIDQMVKKLKKEIQVFPVGKKSDVISIGLNTSNSLYSELVINELIDVFNQDGITDRQLIHKRTIDFVNTRYSFLAGELDSIEIDKKTFKIENKLANFEANAIISLEKRTTSEQEVFLNENQLFIVSTLLESLNELDSKLLPSNIGIENIEINTLIENYNKTILEQRKLISSAGPNNPAAKQLNNIISDSRDNIIFSLKNYLEQLKIIKDKLTTKSIKLNKQFSLIPDQEKSLRAIERNQQIKEALYLFLLQKGEEAQVSYAVTEPSLKVVEYAISNSKPISPKSNYIFLFCILAGFLLPFSTLYLIFLFDNKVHSREDLEKMSLNIVGEIPFFDLSENEKVFNNPDDRSIISESFRMLMSNVRYLQKNDTKSNVILVTSSIKGEGKTLNAVNLALSFSSVDKKVLLIGCDLRNPQLHKYINFNKNTPGLVDFLVDNKIEWKNNIINPFNEQSLDILLSGPLPPNPLNLINNGNIDILLKDARKTYDHIIIDSAPTLLVADTQSLINKSDILIFLTRCNVTDRDVLSHICKVSDESETNVGVVLNGVGQKNSYGYTYGYRYGYGYNYKYSYNYGYGYGYSSDDEKS